MGYFERKEKSLTYLRSYESISNHEAQGLTNAHRNTITSDFIKLIKENLIQRIGIGKGTRYSLIEAKLYSEDLLENLWSRKDRQTLKKFFSKEKRKKVFFDQTVETSINTEFGLPGKIETIFNNSKPGIDEKRIALSESERKRKKEKLIIDLSWASSRIEGNTYSLLETEVLIKFNETTQGKSLNEAKMIINHKNALSYIREQSRYKQLSKQNVFELHQQLIDGLGVPTGFRKRLVHITNSSYVPCDNEFQIVSIFKKTIEKINEIQSVLAKALAANLLIAYLQPFEDGNKRTSRMLGNAILLAHGFLPLSFSHTPKEEYIKSILYFYEKQDPRYFMYLFLKELNYSFREYIG